ncbi:MAG: hypothetical protein H0T84_04790 [Tatlockia sp.]|nr:hypothetical protein [Tatlockia sp.]
MREQREPHYDPTLQLPYLPIQVPTELTTILSKDKHYELLQITIDEDKVTEEHVRFNNFFNHVGWQQVPLVVLYQLDNLTEKLFATRDQQYKFEFLFDKTNISIIIPDEMNHKLLSFLRHYKPRINYAYCCIHFAYELSYGRGIIPDIDEGFGYYFKDSQEPLDETTLLSGDIIHLYNADKDINRFAQDNHWAVYIGQGYYLSLFGNAGFLYLTNLEAMNISFNLDKAVKATVIPSLKKKCINSLENTLILNSSEHLINSKQTMFNFKNVDRPSCDLNIQKRTLK